MFRMVRPLQMRIPNGARDEDLLLGLDESEPEFPVDTLRPSCCWFMHQIDFPTALDYEIINRKVVNTRVRACARAHRCTHTIRSSRWATILT